MSDGGSQETMRRRRRRTSKKTTEPDTAVKENPASPPPAKQKREEVDDFLDGLFPPREDKKDQEEEEDEAAPLLQNPDTPECPRCHVLLEYHESPRSDGTVWRYVRCPESKFFTKCFVTCEVENQLGTYLAKVRHQLHEAYRHTPRSLDMAQWRCFCPKSLVLC